MEATVATEGIRLTEEQEKACRIIGSKRVSLLTGGPGTGKTTTLSVFAKELNPTEVMYCAPTGRAAQRMSEALNEAGIENARASTVHSLLQPIPAKVTGKGWEFRYHRYSRLPFKTIIVDEVSMLDNATAWSLFQAVRHDAKVILIGDQNQLPPVGNGAFLYDIIRSGHVPHAHLTQVHRFAGRIAHICHQICTNKPWQPSKSIDLDANAGPYGPENFRHFERATPEQACAALMEAMPRIKERGFDLMTDVQVICSRNESGGVNRKHLNKILQGLLNPDGERAEDIPYRIGDKIMCLKNGTRETYDKDGFKSSAAYIANGEIGTCVGLGKKFISVQFGTSGIVRFHSGGFESEITLAYAITVHKSQGGGWPVTIYMIDEQFGSDRSLVYTGLSRAKKLEVTIGRIQSLYRQCAKVAIVQRKTFLAEDIHDQLECTDL